MAVIAKLPLLLFGASSGGKKSLAVTVEGSLSTGRALLLLGGMARSNGAVCRGSDHSMPFRCMP